MNKRLKLCPFCLSEAKGVYTHSDGTFTHVTCGNHMCKFGRIMSVEMWNNLSISKNEIKKDKDEN